MTGLGLGTRWCLTRTVPWGAIILAGVGCTRMASDARSKGEKTNEPYGNTVAPDSGAAGEGVEVAGETAGGDAKLGGVFNARTLGSLASRSGKHLRPDALIRSGDLSAISADGCRRLDSLDIRLVLDLRDDPDRSAAPDAPCAITGRTYTNIELPKLLPPGADTYLRTLDALEPKLPDLFWALARAEGPILVHCVIGRDRANLVTALVLMALDIEEETILAEFVRNQDPSVVVDRAWFSTVLARIQDAGGVSAYLERHGVTKERLTEIRSALLE